MIAETCLKNAYLYDLITDHSIIVPWPLGYEILRTRLVRNRIALSRIESDFKSRKIVWVDSSIYNEEALELTFNSITARRHPISMVDYLLRLMLDDSNLKIDWLATWNTKDFIDICQARSIQIIPN